MIPPLPLAPSAGLAAVLFAFALSGGLVFARPGAERRWVALGSSLLLCGLLVGAVLWKLGDALGVLLLWTAIPVLGAVVISLPAVLVLTGLSSLFERKPMAPPVPSPGAKLSRRAALAIPLGAGSLGALGFSRGSALAELRPLELICDELHPDLHGLKILQLTDLHLGVGLDARDLRELLAALRSCRPDLVLLTGDVADRTDALAESLPILSSLAPRYGTFAVLGNHEYLSGACETMIETYRASEVRLLIDRSETLAIGRARLALLGIDDPFGKSEPSFFARALARCASDKAADFRLLMSHRPEVFPHAAARGIELTLAGHTHGGQIGWLGRSLFERLGSMRWLWGWYRSGRSALYTSSGAGDWFPFRLGCPREAPLIVLRSSKRRDEQHARP